MKSDDKTELYIVKGLISFDDFLARFIDKIDYKFFTKGAAVVVKAVQQFYVKHHKKPSIQILCDTEIPQILAKKPEHIQQCIDVITTASLIKFDKEDYYDWLGELTKEFIQEKRIELALVECVNLMEAGKRQEAIKKVIDASHINFDESLGLDYWEDIEQRIERMKSPDQIIPTGTNTLDEHIGGGWRRKMLAIFGAATNVGKTLILGDTSKKLVEAGFNGLYVTLEINEDILANRIDANITDINMKDLTTNPDAIMRDLKERKQMAEASGKPFGRLIIKEYPPATMSSNQLLALVKDLNVKRNGFKPDFIVVDYLGLMIPNGKGFSDNTYGKLKTVAEELRAVAVKLNVPIFSAVQVNRSGYEDSEIGLEKTSDSMGIPMTADIMIMVSRTEDLAAANQLYYNIAKSRFSKNGSGFLVSVDYDHMRINDLLDGNTIENQQKRIKENIQKIKKSDPPKSGETPPPSTTGKDDDDILEDFKE
jgi:hypothetical protein